MYFSNSKKVMEKAFYFIFKSSFHSIDIESFLSIFFLFALSIFNGPDDTIINYVNNWLA